MRPYSDMSTFLMFQTVITPPFEAVQRINNVIMDAIIMDDKNSRNSTFVTSVSAIHSSAAYLFNHGYVYDVLRRSNPDSCSALHIYCCERRLATKPRSVLKSAFTCQSNQE